MHNTKLNIDPDLQFELYNSIPDYIKVLREKNKPTIWLPKEKALHFERIKMYQNDRHFLMTDYDVKDNNPFVDHNHYDIEPNALIYNNKNGNHQALWYLENKVFCQKETKFNKSYLYLRAIESAYDVKYNCDKHFARYIHRNPYFKGVSTDWRHNNKHSLRELAEVVNLNSSKIKSGNKAIKGNGRNCTVFDDLRFWAYKQDKTKISFENWLKRCLTQAITYNSFPTPMQLQELQAIAHSVAQYTFNHTESFEDYVKRTHTSEIQSKRGKLSAAKRWGNHVKQEPWIELNISKATYYRRLKNGQI